jgi:hypothetical protein
MTMQEIEDEGALLDDEPGTPHGFGFEGDEAIARESHCTSCGRHGLEYRPFVSKRPVGPDTWTGQERHSYRVFAVCPGCDCASEF